jgi:small subunit ribosomal protein S21
MGLGSGWFPTERELLHWIIGTFALYLNFPACRRAGRSVRLIQPPQSLYYAIRGSNGTANDGLKLEGKAMIKVKSRGNETVDQMLRRFKKLCEKEGVMKDMKRVSYFEKPSEKRRRRLRKAQSRAIKAALEGGIVA